MRGDASTIWLQRAGELLDAPGRVLVVGDVMLDHYITGSVDRISPEAPVPVLRVHSERTALGGAANVAAGVVALGAACRLVGAAGADEPGERLRELLRASSIDDADLVSDPERPTTLKTRIVARHQQMLRVDREAVSSLGADTAAALEAQALHALEWADAVILEDYDKGVFSADLATRVLTAARERGIPSVVDPKLRHFFDFPGAYVFKPNVRELAAALGLESAPRTPEALRPLMERLGCDHLLITLGEEGMLLVTGDGTDVQRIPSRAHEVFDVTGAGDTVSAVLGVALGRRATVAEAATLANVAAGLEVSRLGAVPITREDLLGELDARPEATEEEL